LQKDMSKETKKALTLYIVEHGGSSCLAGMLLLTDETYAQL